MSTRPKFFLDQEYKAAKLRASMNMEQRLKAGAIRSLRVALYGGIAVGLIIGLNIGVLIGWSLL